MKNSETPIIFLAMFWGGGGPYQVSEIIGVYDWVNRSIPSQAEMQTALNDLLARKLIERKEGCFAVSPDAYATFDAFRKKKRKNRFDTVTMWFEQLPDLADVPLVVELTESEYKDHLNAYRKAFREAMKSS